MSYEEGQTPLMFVSDYETHGAGFSVRYEVFKTVKTQAAERRPSSPPPLGTEAFPGEEERFFLYPCDESA
ncbi:Neuropilin-1a [Liparis tanakae]|uniref:Neuropilin-1a n=1 Tax=Liparis tanakae TaxID=230148 RepID=A0A4Z2F7H0_9TELE|nr:Neuropilin-1a [Liparis tanakae]